MLEVIENNEVYRKVEIPTYCVYVFEKQDVTEKVWAEFLDEEGLDSRNDILGNEHIVKWLPRPKVEAKKYESAIVLDPSYQEVLDEIVEEVENYELQ